MDLDLVVSIEFDYAGTIYKPGDHIHSPVADDVRKLKSLDGRYVQTKPLACACNLPAAPSSTQLKNVNLSDEAVTN